MKELLKGLERQRINNLVSIYEVVTDKDMKMYRKAGFSVARLDILKAEFPELVNLYGSKLYYSKIFAGDIIYYDYEEMTMFSTMICALNKNVIYRDAMNMYERMEYCVNYCKKLQKDGEYGKLFYIVPGEYKMAFTLAEINNVPVEYRYKLFIDMYVDVNFGFGMIDEEFWADILSTKKPQQKSSTTRRLNKVVDGEMIHIYRGISEASTEDGFSYTLDKEIAEKFAKINSPIGNTYTIIEADINKKDVIEYITERGEEEILVLPSKLKNVVKNVFEK